jgi:tol-pal system protein YbgF
MRTVLVVGVTIGLFTAGPTWARDKEHQQIAADVRILQEQSQQLQNLIGQLSEALKAVNKRLDDHTKALEDQAKANVKAFADERLIVETVSKDLGVLREKVDDSNTRLGSVSQEVEALRGALQSQLAPIRTAPPPDSVDGTVAGGGLPEPIPSAAAPIPIGTSPTRLYDMAYSSYASALWDLSIDGFRSFIRSFPKSDMADDAQVLIGNAFLQDGKNDKAVEEYDIAIRTYPNGNAIPEAYYKKGLALKNLKQIDSARQAWELVVKTYPNSDAASLARQQLQQLPTPQGR